MARVLANGEGGALIKIMVLYQHSTTAIAQSLSNSVAAGIMYLKTSS